MANEIEACKACEDLKALSNNFVLNGVTETECASLNKNFGLNDQIPVLHDNCEDLRTTLDCLIGQLIEELPKYDNCDWKAYASSYMRNLYTVLRAMMCGDCGQWNEINYLWDETERLWRETQKLWEEFIKVWNETDKLWRETAKLWSEIYTVWQELIAIWEYIDVLEGRILNLEDRMGAVEDRLDVVEERLDVVDNRLDAVENRVTVVENRITNAETNITNLTNRVTTIEGNISTINNRLTNIDNSIRDIYEQLEGLQNILSQNFAELTYGTDFTYQVFNGVQFEIAPRVYLIESDYNIILRVSASATPGNRNYMNLTRTNDLVLRHSIPVAEAQTSWLFNINFIGSYARLNTISALSTTTVAAGSEIWNLSPTSARAKWPVPCSLSRNVVVGGTTYRYLYSAVQMADGYNDQLSTGKEAPLNDVSQGLNFSYETTFALNPN